MAGSPVPPADLGQLRTLLGGTDIYLLDQLMKGRIGVRHRILDAGCGCGRNLEPFLRTSCDVWAVDESARAARQTLELAREVGAERPAGWVSKQRIGKLAFTNGAFDVVVLAGVLYHVPNPLETLSICRSLLRQGGVLLLETVFDPTSQRSTLLFNLDTQPPPCNEHSTYFLASDEALKGMLRFNAFDVVGHAEEHVIQFSLAAGKIEGRFNQLFA